MAERTDTRQAGFHPEQRTGQGGGNGGGQEIMVVQQTKLLDIQKAESDTMLRLAREFPRDEAAILKGALAELDLVPEEAGKAYYSIPYQDNATGRTVKVEGPTIRAAESLSRRWGNIRHGARLVGEDDNGWDIEAVAIDLQTNTWVMRPFRQSKWEKRRSGQVVMLDEKRQLQALQSGISKCVRNAILAVLPAYYKSAYDKKARAIVGGNLEQLADPKTIAAVRTAFSKYNVTDAELEKYAEKLMPKWTGGEIADLRGLWNAINDGQTTVEEAFRSDVSGAGTADDPKVVTPETLLGSVARVEVQEDADPGTDYTDPNATRPTQPELLPTQPTAAAAAAKPIAAKPESRAPAARKAEPKAEPKPAAAPAPPKGLPESEQAALLAEIAAVTEENALDALTSELFGQDGRALKASKEQKKHIIEAVSARRNQLG